VPRRGVRDADVPLAGVWGSQKRIKGVGYRVRAEVITARPARLHRSPSTAGRGDAVKVAVGAFPPSPRPTTGMVTSSDEPRPARRHLPELPGVRGFRSHPFIGRAARARVRDVQWTGLIARIAAATLDIPSGA